MSKFYSDQFPPREFPQMVVKSKGIPPKCPTKNQKTSGRYLQQQLKLPENSTNIPLKSDAWQLEEYFPYQMVPFQVSNEKNLGWLGYIGDYTNQLYRDCNKPWNKDPY